MSSTYEESTGFYSSRVPMSSLDETWTTPRDKWNEWNAEFGFTLDAAAVSTSTLCSEWYGPDHPDILRRDALVNDWVHDSKGGAVWFNPPYGRTIGKFMEKAHNEARRGATVVCLVPARTDTAWWHEYCIMHEVRFIRGRLKFGDGKNSAPFPSALVIMRGGK